MSPTPAGPASSAPPTRASGPAASTPLPLEPVLANILLRKRMHGYGQAGACCESWSMHRRGGPSCQWLACPFRAAIGARRMLLSYVCHAAWRSLVCACMQCCIVQGLPLTWPDGPACSCWLPAAWRSARPPVTLRSTSARVRPISAGSARSGLNISAADDPRGPAPAWPGHARRVRL